VTSGLRQRVVTALLLAALIIVILLWLPPGVAVATVMVAVAAGAWEWAGLAGINSSAGRVVYAAAVVAGIAAAWWLTRAAPALAGFLWCTAAWWVLSLAWLVLAPGRGGSGVTAAAGFAVLVPAAVGLGRLVQLEPSGQVLLLFLLVLVAAADIGAYFGGRAFGRHKLAPRVSPNKTWEGLWAGMLAAAGVGTAGGLLFGEPLLPWVFMCMAVALVSVVGDLVESMFKRKAGLKDSSALLPGHGGVLDRLDSLTAAGPVFLLGLLVLGMSG
jgi:phosphatidate cytidylyltransferase